MRWLSRLGEVGGRRPTATPPEPPDGCFGVGGVGDGIEIVYGLPGLVRPCGGSRVSGLGSRV